MHQRSRTSFLLFALMLSSLLAWSPTVHAADGDGDGFDDDVDDCPFAVGSSTLDRTGCPDADGDGISDAAQGEVAVFEDAQRAISEYTSSSRSSQARAIAVAPNGMFAVGADSGDQIYLGNGAGTLVKSLFTIGTNPRAIDWSPNGSLLAVGGYGFSGDGANVQVHTMDWTTQTASVLVNLSANHYDDTFAMRFSPDGSKLFVGGKDDNVTIYRTSDWMIEGIVSLGSDDVYSIATSPDGRQFAVTHAQEMSVHWVSNGSQVWNVHNHSDVVLALDWSPDGQWIITGGDDAWMQVYHAGNGTIETSLYQFSDVNAIAFNRAGSQFVLATDSGSATTIYNTADWSAEYSIGDFPGGSGQGASGRRGARAVAWSLDESKIHFGAKYYGGVYTFHSESAYHWMGGDVTGELMENRFREYAEVAGDFLPHHYNASVTQVTQSQCAGVNPMGDAPLLGASSSTAAKGLTTPLANYSLSGMRTCDGSGDALIEVPVARMPASLFVKPNSAASQCITTLGGLSMGQMRWLLSGASESTLATDGVHPGVTMSSLAPNDDQDGIIEWRDLDSSCAAEPVHVQHRWENRSVTQMVAAKMFCSHCSFPENWFAPDFDRYRLVQELRGDIINGVANNDHLLGFTELRVGLAASNVHQVPIVDNWTHGAVDAIAAGGVAITPSVEEAKNGTWPFQDDYRLVTRADDLVRTRGFIAWMLDEAGQQNFDEIGFVRLSPHARVLAADRIGIDMRHILPDDDADGVWNGEDDCPGTVWGWAVDSAGCAQNQLDDDDDGLVNSEDDCPNASGTSTDPTVGCPDGDGDGWADTSDAFPTEPSQWRDLDGDGYGDEMDGFEGDACPNDHGLSHMDRFGCADSDGDGWSDDGDMFPADAMQWVDGDGDGVGDNHSFSEVVDAIRVGEVGDAFPLDITQHKDRDGDGYGDNATGFLADTCPDVAGSSNQNGRIGCPDMDGDGWADGDDAFPDEASQHADQDGDGYGDDLTGIDPDMCPGTPAAEILMVDEFGCAPSERDSDLDGVSDADDQCPETPVEEAVNADADGCTASQRDTDGDGVLDSADLYPEDPTQAADNDGDGYPDNSSGTNGDDCPTEAGTSTGNLLGCPDGDHDGWADSEDVLPNNPSQWADSDGDGYYDNFPLAWMNDPMRTEEGWPGGLQSNPKDPDRCPLHANSFQNVENPGCPEDVFPAGRVDEGPLPTGPTDRGDGGGMSTTSIVLISIGLLVLLALVGGVTVLVLRREDPAPKHDLSKVGAQTEPEPESEVDDGYVLEEDPNYKVDDDGCEWWYDEGVWWYRTPEMDDWAEHGG